MNSDSRHPILQTASKLIEIERPLPPFKASRVLNPWRFDFDTDPDFDLDDVDPLTLFSAWALLPPIEIGIGIRIGIDIRTSINQWSFLDAVSSSAQSTKHSGLEVVYMDRVFDHVETGLVGSAKGLAGFAMLPEI